MNFLSYPKYKAAGLLGARLQVTGLSTLPLGALGMPWRLLRVE